MQEERSAETRGRLLQAAVEVIREKGYSAARTVDIAERAGVTRGALQHHFPTKSDLLLAVCDDVYRQMLSHLEQASGAGGGLDARLDALLGHIWAVYTSESYHAFVEILTGTRADDEMVARLGSFSAETERVLREWWQNAFVDVPVSKERLEATRHLVRSALRGMTVESDFFRQPPRYYERQIALLREMVADIMEGRRTGPPRRRLGQRLTGLGLPATVPGGSESR